MHSKNRHKIRFQFIVYFKLNKSRAKLLKNISKKDLNLMCKLIRKQEIISLQRDKLSHRSQEKRICKNELINIDF